MLVEPDPVFMHILQTQLALTVYETMTFLAIVHGRNQSSAISEFRIGDLSVPRPKVYGALDSLSKKGYIVMNSEGSYEPNSTRLAEIKNDAERIAKKYTDFIDSLYSLSVGNTKIVQKVKNDIIDLLDRLGYKIEAELKMSRERRKHLEARFWQFRRFVERNSDPRKLRRLDEYLYVADFVAESPNSGIKTGIILDSEEEDIKRRTDAILMSLESSDCSAGIVVVTRPVKKGDISEAEEEAEETHKNVKTFPFSSFRNLKLFVTSTEGDYLEKIEHYLNELDLNWSRLKGKLAEIEKDRDKEKQKIRELMYQVDTYLKDTTKYITGYKSTFEDILMRIRNDLDTSDHFLAEIDGHIQDYFNLLGNKNLFPSDDINDTVKELELVHEKLEETERELMNFVSEIYSIPSNSSPYTKHGLRLNPFSLSVPLSKPTTVINQRRPKEICTTFINKIGMGVDTNLMLIMGKQGVGKSHFLNYFANEINKNKFGKAIAVRIRCKSNKDLIDLYLQITEGIKEILEEKQEVALLDQVSRFLDEAGSPRLVQDLMRILKELELIFSTKGYGNLFIMIDEFENTLPPAHKHHLHIGHRSSLRVGTPESISQLDSLSKLSGTGFIVTVREEEFEKWQEQLEKRLSKFEKKFIIYMKPLSYEDARAFLIHRLQDKEFRIYGDKHLWVAEPPALSSSDISSIWKKGSGNPRLMLRLASAVFRQLVYHNITKVEPVFEEPSK
jgi:sugar-specific transcriptional regulator TrmB/Cdc6-like AAA superfamily ATPase